MMNLSNSSYLDFEFMTFYHLMGVLIIYLTEEKMEIV